jgi:hypothetical protein
MKHGDMTTKRGMKRRRDNNNEGGILGDTSIRQTQQYG